MWEQKTALQLESDLQIKSVFPKMESSHLSHTSVRKILSSKWNSFTQGNFPFRWEWKCCKSHFRNRGFINNTSVRFKATDFRMENIGEVKFLSHCMEQPTTGQQRKTDPFFSLSHPPIHYNILNRQELNTIKYINKTV